MDLALVSVAVLWAGITALGVVGNLSLRPLPRRREGRPSVSIVVPARNDAERIEATVDGLLRQQDVDAQVLVVDDGSTDATARILERMRAEHPSLEVLRVDAVPDGWLGKCNACALGAERAGGEWILFVDADTRCSADVVNRAVAAAVEQDADHLCLMPDLGPCSLGGQATISLTMFGILGLSVGVNRDLPFGYAGVGSFTLLRRSAYDAIGGHAGVRMEVVEDLALGYRVRRHGFRSRIYMATEDVQVRWAHSIRSFVALLEKNVFAKLGFGVGRLLIESCVILSLWCLPVWGWFEGSAAGLAAGLAMALAALPAVWTASRYRWNLLAGVLAPWMLPVLVLASVNSARQVLSRGGVVWRGVHYPLAELRAARGLVSRVSRGSGKGCMDEP